MDNLSLGARIKKLRINKNLSQLDFSKLINVSNTTLSMYESDNRIPSDDVKKKIADFFGVSLDYLITGKTNTMAEFFPWENEFEQIGDGSLGQQSNIPQCLPSNYRRLGLSQ